MPNENLHQKSLKNIRQALGVGVFLFSGVLLVAPATHIWGLGFGIFYLFGISGYWGFLPFLLIIAAFLSIKGDISNKVISWRIYLGYAFFMLGLSVLLSHLAFSGNEALGDVSPFLKRLKTYEDANHSPALFFASDLGGGLLGYFLSALFLKGGIALLWTLSILLMVCGFVLAFYPLLKKFTIFLIRRIKASNAKRKAAKETKRIQEEAEATGSDELQENPQRPLVSEPSSPENAPLPALGASSNVPPLSYTPNSLGAAPQIETSDEDVDPRSLSRSEKYSAKPSSPLPQEIVSPIPLSTPPLSPREMARAGLQEAVFMPDGVSFSLAPQEVKAAPTPSPVSSSNPNLGIAPSVTPVSPRRTASAVVEPTISTPIAPEEESSGESPAFTPSPSFSVPSFASVSNGAAEEAPSLDVEEQKTPANPAPIAPAMEPSRSHVVMENVLDVPSASPSDSVVSAPRSPAPSKPSFAPSPANVSSPAQPPMPSIPVPSPAPVSTPAPQEPEASQPKAAPRPSYKFPPIDLLTTYQNQSNLADKQAECDHRCQLINQAMTDLHAGAHVVSYCIGPSVTRYDIQTDPDVSVSSLGKFVKDISVRLGGVSTRYEEVVRGKSTSGLEIANSTTTTVSLKEMVNSLPKGDKYNLVIPFGKSISGEYIFSDLSEFPHMLVAGTTGSGKSIFMHGVIMSLIMRNRPEDLKLVVVDPKRVEMGKYKDLPHLLCPIIKEPSQAKVCFQKLISEMERRYTLFELSSVSNIRQFNSEYAPEAGVERLPFIVVVIDEYADLVDTCKDIGESVVRLAQKARAAGIHLVIATQRPSVSVITGVIKANLPCRVALSMNNATDSLTILGEGGAEDLVGHGDMLVDCSQVARNGFTRCQGCMVDNNEIKAVTDFIRSEAVVTYDPAFLDLVDHEAQEKAEAAAAPVISKSDLKASQGDDLYNTIKADIMTKEYTSISKIQREYGVGFPRAGKIFARLQSEGIVAAAPETASSAKGCKVLVHADASSANLGSTDQSSVTLSPNGGGSR